MKRSTFVFDERSLEPISKLKAQGRYTENMPNLQQATTDITSVIARVRELENPYAELGIDAEFVELKSLAILLADECERLQRIVDKASKLCKSVEELQRIVDTNKGNE